MAEHQVSAGTAYTTTAKLSASPNAPRSFRLDARRLDDGPPLLDLGLLVSCKRLRRLLLPRWKLKAHLDQPLSYLRITQGVPDRDVELVNNRSWRVPGCEK